MGGSSSETEDDQVGQKRSRKVQRKQQEEKRRRCRRRHPLSAPWLLCLVTAWLSTKDHASLALLNRELRDVILTDATWERFEVTKVKNKEVSESLVDFLRRLQGRKLKALRLELYYKPRRIRGRVMKTRMSTIVPELDFDTVLCGLEGLRELTLNCVSSVPCMPPSVTSVNVASCVVDDIYLVACCEHLASASFGKTNVSDIGPMALTRDTLTSLDVSQTRVTNLGPLCDFAKLTFLDVSQCSHIDLTTLTSLPNLTILKARKLYAPRWFDATHTFMKLDQVDLHGYCGIVPVNAFASAFRWVNELNVGGSVSPTLKGLSKMRSFRKLTVATSRALRNLEGLAGLTMLQELDCSGCLHLEDISDLLQVEPLGFRSLTLDCCRALKTVEAVSGLYALRHLSVRETGISSLEPLAGLTFLEYLDICWNPIDSIECLDFLIHLKTFKLANTRVNHLQVVRHFGDLELIDVEDSFVRDLSFLTVCRQLHTVLANRTNVREVGMLKVLPRLRHLDLRNTFVSDVSELRFHRELRVIEAPWVLRRVPLCMKKVVKSMEGFSAPDRVEEGFKQVLPQKFVYYNA